MNANSANIPGASGVGLDAALANYANWMQTTLLPGYCESFGKFRAIFRFLKNGPVRMEDL